MPRLNTLNEIIELPVEWVRIHENLGIYRYDVCIIILYQYLYA